MRMTSVMIRGEEHDVKYRDYGYEFDTNAHEIDWEFVDPESAPKDLTPEEEESVFIQLAKIEDHDYPEF